MIFAHLPNVFVAGWRCGYTYVNIRGLEAAVGLIPVVNMASTEIEFQPANQKKPSFSEKVQNTRTFFWNRETKEFMGRTFASWGEWILYSFVVIKL